MLSETSLLADAARLIEKIGTTGADSAETCIKADQWLSAYNSFISGPTSPPTQDTKSSEASYNPEVSTASSVQHNPYGFCRSHGHVNSSHRCRDFDGSLPESESCSESEIAELRRRGLWRIATDSIIAITITELRQRAEKADAEVVRLQLEIAGLRVKPIVDREKESENLDDVMNIRLR